MATATVDTRKFLSETKFYEGYSRYKEDESRYESWDEAVAVSYTHLRAHET